MQFLVENNERVYLLLSIQKGVSSSLLLQLAYKSEPGE